MNRYQILGEINQGGVGVVLKAWDTRLNRHVAIKRFLSPEQLKAAGNVEGDLIAEASTLSSLQHPNIVSIYDVENLPEAGPQVIMEYLNGQDLEQAVSQAALTLEDFYMVAQQTLDALSNAHRMNLLHRDIKPSNIQVTWLANGKFVSKFVDFGLAKYFEKPARQTVRSDGTVMGSVYYMAPEQLERRPLDHRSDLYSLGCVFYFALTMHRPFTGGNVHEVINAHLGGTPLPLREYRPNVPADLGRWVMWLMSRRSDDRPRDAETALNALRQIIAGERPTGMPGLDYSTQPTFVASLRTTGVRHRPATFPEQSAHVLPTRRAGQGPRVMGQRTSKGKSRRFAARTAAIVAGIAIALATSVIIMAGGSSPPRKRPEPKESARDVLNIAKKETELKRTREELAAAQARLAIAQSAPDKSALPTPVDKPADLTRPPMQGMVMWFDAAMSTMADEKGSPAVTGGPVGRWRDLSPAGGSVVFDYTASGTKDNEQFFPTLATAPAGAGLIAPRPVLRFNGSGQNLVLRDKDKAGDPLGTQLDGDGLSVLIVFRNTGPDAPDGLLAAREAGRKAVLWSLGTRGGGIQNGGITDRRAEAPLYIAESEREFLLTSLVLDAKAGTAHRTLINAANVKASGDYSTRGLAGRRLEVIRLGTSDSQNADGQNCFSGDVAELLIYNTALERAPRHHAENYLRLKYFGSRDATISARK